MPLAVLIDLTLLQQPLDPKLYPCISGSLDRLFYYLFILKIIGWTLSKNLSSVDGFHSSHNPINGEMRLCHQSLKSQLPLYKQSFTIKDQEDNPNTKGHTFFK